MKKELSPKQPGSKRSALQPGERDELLAALQARFDANQARHPGLAWAKVQARQFGAVRQHCPTRV